MEHGMPFDVCIVAEKLFGVLLRAHLFILDIWLSSVVDFFVLDFALFYFDALIDELMEAVEPSQ